MKHVLVALLFAFVINFAIAMDTEPSILHDLQRRVQHLLETGGGVEDLMPDDFETLDWLQWDGNPIARYLADKLMEKRVKSG